MSTSNFFVFVEMTAKPGRRDELVSRLADMFPDTRAREGFVRLELLTSADDEQTIVIVEAWETPAAHAAYTQWRKDRGDSGSLADLLDGPSTHRSWNDTRR